jgi:hypothetical protein
MNVYVILAVYVIFSLMFALLDIRYGEIPRLALWSGILLITGSRFALLGAQQGLAGLAGCALGFAVYVPVYFFVKGKLGLADVWYAAFTGCAFGPVWWYAVSITGCILALAYMRICRLGSIAFIPFMAAGGIVVVPFYIINAMPQ